MQWANKTAVLCTLLFALGMMACSQQEELTEPERKTFVLSETMLGKIGLDTARITNAKGILNLNGKIEADQNRLVEIFPIVGGNVLSVTAELGDYVKKNQVLGVIRSEEVAEYDRQLIDARSDVLVAQKDLSVKADLYASKLVSERDIVAARRELEKAEAALKRIQETFSIYGFNARSEYFLKSPIDGFVISKKINRDITLPAGHQESVFTVAELSEVWVMANVYESDISKIQQGMEVVITTLSYPGEPIHGEIDKIFNVLDPATKTMKVRIKVPNPDFRLKPEMLATTRIVYREPQSLPSVPASAIIFDKNRHFVMIFKDRYNIETREVEVYKTAEGTAWLSRGVTEGEIVISRNQLFIYDALNE